VRARAVARMAAARGIALLADHQFHTFEGATKVPADLADAPDRMGDLFKAWVRVWLREALREAWPDGVIEHIRPNVTVQARPDENDVRILINAAYVRGRYRKLERGISQTPFFCSRCKGKRSRRGQCDACDGTGRDVADAVSDFVTLPIRQALGGRRAGFHGAGREDVDVRMLGSGRPFVVSVDSPRRRTLDPADVAARVAELSHGRVEVSDLVVIPREEARLLTDSRAEKTYRVTVAAVAGAELPADAAERLAGLGGVELAQRTPVRVSRRRADLVRRRRVLELVVESADAAGAVIVIRTDAGTYVKEFVSGDEDRTTPSVSGALGVPCVCASLDVLAVG